MFVKGVDGSAKLNYEMDVKVVQEASEAVIGKLARDTGGQADKNCSFNWCLRLFSI